MPRIEKERANVPKGVALDTLAYTLDLTSHNQAKNKILNISGHSLESVD
jgi:hypothetical protein